MAFLVNVGGGGNILTNVVTTPDVGGGTSTTGSNTTVTSSVGFLSTSSLLLASATLTGGLVLVSATGSVPQALTLAADVYITGAVALTRPGTCFDQDGNHFWVSDSGNQVKRFLLSTGVIDKVVTGSTTDPTRNAITSPACLTPGFGNRLWFTSTAQHMVGFVDMTNATPICEMFSGSGLPSNPNHVIEHMAGRILVRAGSAAAAGTYQEFAYSGTGSANVVAYTGAQIIEGTTFWDAVPDMSSSVYTVNSAGLVAKRSNATLTASATFTPIGGNFVNMPGYSTSPRLACYHPSAAKLYVHQAEDSWFQIDVTTMLPAFPGRVFDSEEFGMPIGSLNTTAHLRQPIAFSPDGTLMAFCTLDREANATTLNNIRVRRLGVQRARWAFTPASASHVYGVYVAGHLDNAVGSIASQPNNKWLNQEYSFKKTKFFYSTDGGTTRTEFTQGSFLNSGAGVVVSGTLTIDADMQITPANMYGVAPYIGDDQVAGRAGTIIFDPNQ